MCRSRISSIISFRLFHVWYRIGVTHKRMPLSEQRRAERSGAATPMASAKPALPSHQESLVVQVIPVTTILGTSRMVPNDAVLRWPRLYCGRAAENTHTHTAAYTKSMRTKDLGWEGGKGRGAHCWTWNWKCRPPNMHTEHTVGYMQRAACTPRPFRMLRGGNRGYRMTSLGTDKQQGVPTIRQSKDKKGADANLYSLTFKYIKKSAIIHTAHI